MGTAESDMGRDKPGWLEGTYSKQGGGNSGRRRKIRTFIEIVKC